MGLKGFEKRRIFGKVLGVERKKILKTYFERKIKKKWNKKKKKTEEALKQSLKTKKIVKWSLKK